MSNYIFDSGPLITACKFSVAGRLVVDHILDHCQMTVSASVDNEVTIAGSRYPDARAAQQRITNAQIAVVAPPIVPDLERLGFKAFLSERYRRYRRGEVSFGRLAEELGMTTWELSHLLEDHGWPASNLPAPEWPHSKAERQSTRIAENDVIYEEASDAPSLPEE